MKIHLIRQLIIILIFVYAGQTNLSGQQNIITGRVLNEHSQRPVQFAHIENFSLKTATFTDTSGFFSLRAHKGDTLVISAIGYYYKMAVVSDSTLDLSTITLFELTERIYDIAEANIYIPGTYQQFKQDFINLELAETDTHILRNELKEIARIAGKEAYDKAMEERKLDGVTLLSMPILSKNEKDRLRLKETIEKENIQNQIYEKFNPEIVKIVTGLTDEDEIIAFMQFCDFRDEYILEVHQLDLMERIAAKFDDYQKKKG